MTEQQKPQNNIPESSPQTQEQLQLLLKQTIKENKSLLTKNSKLQSRYVELFKQHKLLKKDHTVFTTFLSKYYNNSQQKTPANRCFQELSVGQYQLGQLDKIAEAKDSSINNKVQQLSKIIDVLKQEKQKQIQNAQKMLENNMKAEYQFKFKSIKDENNKENLILSRQIESLKKNNKNLNDQILQIRKNSQQKMSQLSKITKEKLKLEHHLNNIRKKEINQQLNIDKQQQQQKIMSQRNEFLSLRQQVQSLYLKRDQLKRQIKEKDEMISKLQYRNLQLEEELMFLKNHQIQLDEKYELIRQCSLEELQNLILNHAQQEVNNLSNIINAPRVEQKDQKEKEKENLVKKNDEIQHEYLKNILIRYIKAQTSGYFDQALTLLEIIGTLLKLDHQSSQTLQNYKAKRKQWWYIKY